MKSVKKAQKKSLYLSVAIITKNRPTDVIDCLSAFNRQTVIPFECIIIDSSTNLRTKQVVQNLKKTSTYPIHYIYEPRHGFPIARNRVLKSAQSDWVAFTDDDCIVDQHWVEFYVRSISNHPHAAAIAGQSESYYPDDIISHATTLNELHWKANGRSGTTILDLETLDNKNVAYNLAFLKKKRIRYDEKRAGIYHGASDDCDLGMQIQQTGGKAYYDSSIVVYHKDLTDIRSYTKRLIDRSLAHATYEQKWHTYRQSLGRRAVKQIRFLPFFRLYAMQHSLSPLKRAVLVFLLLYSSLLIRCVKLYVRLKKNSVLLYV
jgi:glycosyltransferase involved in cell wall biosynthesis